VGPVPAAEGGSLHDDRHLPTACASLVMEVVDDVGTVGELWDELAEGVGNIFLTREWASAWLRHHGSGRGLRIGVCTDGGGPPVGLVPLYEDRRAGIRLLRFIGHGPADRLGPICRPEHREQVGCDLRRFLSSQPSNTVLLADFVGTDEGWAERLGAVTLRREASPAVQVEGRTWDEYLATRSPNFRQQVRRRRRRLEREHDVAFQLAATEAELDAAFADLVRLHGARWRDCGSGALEGGRVRFHRDLASAALQRGWLRLWSLAVEGETVASWYGFRFGGHDWYYQSGRNPAFDSDHVGFVLLTHTMQQCFADGQTSYQLLRGGEPYKQRFATGASEVERFAAAGRPGGRALLAVAARAAGSPGVRRLGARLVGR